MTREQQMYFDQCVDFLARMIEKYGDQIKLSDMSEQELDHNTAPDDDQGNQIAA